LNHFLPTLASSAADEANMLCNVLLLAQKHDKEFSICLKAAHAQLALVGIMPIIRAPIISLLGMLL